MSRRRTCILQVCLSVAITGVLTGMPSPTVAHGCGDLATPNLQAKSRLARKIDRSVAQWQAALPATAGLAYGIVQNGELVHTQGFGVGNLATCRPVTGTTGFYLLSLTKSFTGMAAALLHHEKALELDQSLAFYLDGLIMPAPVNPAQIPLRSLLTHTPAFSNGAINYRTYVAGDLGNDDLRKLLERHSTPADPTFAYSNTGYVLAGMIIEEHTGHGWRELLERRIFAPAGMRSTRTDIEQAMAGDFALIYRMDGHGGFLPGFNKVQAQMHAAGGAVSTVQDLARWIRLNLDGGRLDGVQILPARVVRQAQAPQAQMERTFYRFDRYAYGLGVYHADYEGDLLIHHFGGPIHLSFMPERNLGVIVLSAGTHSTLYSHMIAAYLYDSVSGKPDLEKKYAQEFARVAEGTRDSLKRRRDALSKLEAERTVNSPVRSLEQYTGIYASERLGEMVIRLAEGQLWLTYGVREVPLRVHQPDVFLVGVTPNAPPAPFSFRFASDSEAPATMLDWNGREFSRVE